MRFGVNLFELRKEVRENAKEMFHQFTLDAIRFLEPCVVLGEPLAKYPQFWTSRELEYYMELAEKEGLEINACRILINEDMELVIQDLKKLAQKYQIRQFVVSCPENIDTEVYSNYADEMILLAKALKPVRSEFLICHTQKEIEKKLHGISAYEWLLQKCAGYVYAEVNVGWLVAGGENPKDFLWRNQKYVKALHYKDMKKHEETYEETILGSGIVDMKACFQFARANEMIQYLDMGMCSGSVLEEIRKGRRVLADLTKIRDNTISKLCVLDTETGEIRVLHTYPKIIEAPNWLSDGNTLIYNSEGRIYQYKITEDTEKMIDSGSCDHCNNDHVPSPDNQSLAVSHYAEGSSKIYILPVDGGTPRLVTVNGPSYLHGWSPDGEELAYCAFRPDAEGKRAVDIYTIPVVGGEEKQLTKENGFNDGPEYSPDGKEIWFNSTRSGLMQIWKMNRDGSDQAQMSFEKRNNWFAHVSPDGKKVVNISYSVEGLDIDEHLPNLPVELWLMNRDGSDRKRILSFFGGQGSMNVNSWSPDSKKIALVVYELQKF